MVEGGGGGVMVFPNRVEKTVMECFHDYVILLSASCHCHHMATRTPCDMLYRHGD